MRLHGRFGNFTNGGSRAGESSGFLRYLIGWTVALAFVFSFTGGGNESFAGSASRFAYWFVHVGSGLAVVSWVCSLLQRGPCGRWPLLLQLTVYGVCGAVAFTPLAILFETLLPVAGAPDGPPNWPIQAAREGWITASLAEFGGLAPSFLGSWIVINLAYVVPTGRGQPAKPAVRVVASVEPRHPPTPAAPPETGMEPEKIPPVPAGISPSALTQSHRAHEPPRSVAMESELPETAPSGGVRDRLPQALGGDIIHLRADLNYLHVTTAGGSAMLLYSLARAAAELGDIGSVVHRAHWVAHDHVARTRRTAQGFALILSNGVEVPVSRRRQAEIRARFGDTYQAPSIPPR
jgi:hypothetical protein